MKIAVITDDGKSISMHFGRAQYYLVFTIENGEIVNREMRPKTGHHHFAGQPEYGHDDHDHSDDDSRGHGFGQGAARRHSAMIEAITDCEAILVAGMGRGAFIAMEEAKITPVVTDILDVEEAVAAYLSGEIENRTDLLH